MVQFSVASVTMSFLVPFRASAQNPVVQCMKEAISSGISETNAAIACKGNAPTNSTPNNSTPQSADNTSNTTVIKLNLSDAGVSVGGLLAWGPIGLIQKKSSDWVRLEVNGYRIRVVHTTRATNWLTQTSHWWDHPVRDLAFKPDTCVNSSNCIINGNNGVVVLKNGMSISKGEFKIEYLESNEWKIIAFRVPEKASFLSD